MSCPAVQVVEGCFSRKVLGQGMGEAVAQVVFAGLLTVLSSLSCLGGPEVCQLAGNFPGIRNEKRAVVVYGIIVQVRPV